MLATTGQPGRDPEAWSWEVKWDGWRALVYIDEGLRVRARTGRQVSDSLPELTGLVDALAGRKVILDGELVACPDGKVDFYALAPRMLHSGRMAQWAASQVPITFVAFDLLHLDGQDLTASPLVERKRMLDELHLVGTGLGVERLVSGGRRHIVPGLLRTWARRRGGQAPRRALHPWEAHPNLAQAEVRRVEARPCLSPTAPGTSLTAMYVALLIVAGLLLWAVAPG
jgi:hypothetical protein